MLNISHTSRILLAYSPILIVVIIPASAGVVTRILPEEQQL